jgi:hypothetical protein
VDGSLLHVASCAEPRYNGRFSRSKHRMLASLHAVLGFVIRLVL